MTHLLTHPSPPPAAPLSPEAFTALVKQYQRPLFGFLYGLVQQREQAHDLTQDTFSDAWRAACQQKPPFMADGQPEEVKAWLFQAAYHRAISMLRRRRLLFFESFEARAAAQPDYADPTASFEGDLAEREQLQAALATLAPTDATCLLLRVVQGLSAAEVGAILGVSPEAVHKRLFLAKQRLRSAYLAQAERPRDATRQKEVQ